MGQHPKITLDWALRGLELALRNLGDGWAERRVRRQFHQLLLAVERAALRIEDQPTDRSRSGNGADSIGDEKEAGGDDMFWWFEQQGRYLRCEAQQMATGGYELRIVSPTGSEQVEHFTDSIDLLKRQHAVIDELTRGGWTGPHGWVL